MTKKFETQFNEATESPGFLLWKASNALLRLHRAALKDLDLTPTQFSILACIVHLNERHGPSSQADLSRYTDIDKMLISDVAKSLIKKQLIDKQPNPEDARGFLLAPTAFGIETANQAVVRVEAVDQEFFSGIEAPESFIEGLKSVLAL